MSGGPGRLIPARAGKTLAAHSRAPGPRAHPRAGGENNARRGMKYRGAGSSPRGRGKRGGGHVRPFCVWAHPRAGGENTATLIRADDKTGSSPRGRGKLHPIPDPDNGRGLIPARAGKTNHPTGRGSVRRAHPRAGGENAYLRKILMNASGSSPRGRGKRRSGYQIHYAGGLIPARAGKTPLLASSRTRKRAHPRAGGENSDPAYGRALSMGSSPRGRGKRPGRCVLLRRPGLIPARAGKTVPLMAVTFVAAAHPRAGGENVNRVRTAHYTLGSSPRGRGKRSSSPTHETAAGLIPARAGKTVEWQPRRLPERAHPRAGGENSEAILAQIADIGSSPRGRRKLSDGLDQVENARLIPARAEKTLSDLRFYRADRSDLGNP